jgi:hypothetical protein
VAEVAICVSRLVRRFVPLRLPQSTNVLIQAQFFSPIRVPKIHFVDGRFSCGLLRQSSHPALQTT